MAPEVAARLASAFEETARRYSEGTPDPGEPLAGLDAELSLTIVGTMQEMVKRAPGEPWPDLLDGAAARMGEGPALARVDFPDLRLSVLVLRGGPFASGWLVGRIFGPERPQRVAQNSDEDEHGTVRVVSEQRAVAADCALIVVRRIGELSFPREGSPRD